jgi:hypothetical protein
VYQWNGSGWIAYGGYGERVAVDAYNNAWVITSGSIWTYAPTCGCWTQIPGGGKDIGTGEDGSVWVVGNNNQTYRYDGIGFSDSISGCALAVAADDISHPWVVGCGSGVWRKN